MVGVLFCCRNIFSSPSPLYWIFYVPNIILIGWQWMLIIHLRPVRTECLKMYIFESKMGIHFELFLFTSALALLFYSKRQIGWNTLGHNIFVSESYVACWLKLISYEENVCKEPTQFPLEASFSLSDSRTIQMTSKYLVITLLSYHHTTFSFVYLI